MKFRGGRTKRSLRRRIFHERWEHVEIFNQIIGKGYTEFGRAMRENG